MQRRVMVNHLLNVSCLEKFMRGHCDLRAQQKQMQYFLHAVPIFILRKGAAAVNTFPIGNTKWILKEKKLHARQALIVHL